MKRLTIIAFAVATVAIGYAWGGETDRAKAPVVDTAKVSVTVYRPSGRKTASGKKIDAKNPFAHKWIAVSRDLAKKFPFGTWVELHGAGDYSGIYRIEDLTHKKFKNRVDILVGKKQPLAMMKGVKLTKMEFIAN